MKRIIYAILTAALLLPLKAAAQQADISDAITDLYGQLEDYSANLDTIMSRYESQRAASWAQMNKGLQQCQQYSIVLYGKQSDRFFALARAYQDLEDVLEQYQVGGHPFEKWKNNIDTEIDRFGQLKNLLGDIDTLGSTASEVQRQCIILCGDVNRRLNKMQSEIYSDNEKFETSEARMQEMVEYNAAHFEKTRREVFMERGASYLFILGHLKPFAGSIVRDFKEGAQSLADNRALLRQNIIMTITLAALLLLSCLIAMVLLGKALPQRLRTDEFKAKKRFITAAVSITLFVILGSFAGHTFMTGFSNLASLDLMIYGFLIVDIFIISAAVRFDESECRSVMRCYNPILVTALVFIIFRLLLAGNNLIRLAVPPLMLLSLLWQISALMRHGPFSERFSAITLWLTCIITGITCLISLGGRTFLALMLLIFWIVQLTGMEAIKCIHCLFNKKRAARESSAARLWLNPTVKKLIVPVLSVLSFSVSFRWAASMFSMRSWADSLLHSNMAGAESTLNITVSGLLILLSLAFVIIWALYMVKTALQEIYKENYTTGAIPLIMTLGSILVWFLYAVVCIKVLGINSTGLIAAMGGMGVGLGFALKDTINELFCGLSLLMGRVHLHDYIECDGVRGKIVDVGMRTTTIDTLDGSVIAFPNSQLLSKNFKNLSKSHNWELCTLRVGVGYGTDVERARKVILECLEPVREKISYKEPVVLLGNFGDNSVDLDIKLWILTKEKSALLADIRERIYKTFDKENIEIPFPQRDVHIIS